MVQTMKFSVVGPRFAVLSGTFAAFLLFVGWMPACGSEPDAVPCGQIPANGCPLRGGGTCADPSCGVIYGCYSGVWSAVETCSNPPPSDGGMQADACPVPMFDHTGEVLGCKPDLQNPDCPVQAAEQCASSVCQSDCVDFFMCLKEGWQVVAYCDQDGQLVLMP